MISPPACYGKLPALGDYLRHNAPGPEVGLWWNRFAGMETLPGREAIMPWCFVLAPDVFSWSEGVHVVGVFMPSRDRIGRRYPFVVWQKVSARGLRHGSLFAPGHAGPRNWLFWLSRLVFAHVRPVAEADAMEDFPPALERLWTLFRPSWLDTFRGGAHAVDEARCRELVGPLSPPDTEDGSLEGVRFMPWPEWPEVLWEPRALCWFWQQDHEGRYLRAIRDYHLSKRVLSAICSE